ncbi:MAG: amidohydrolase family protein, partial [Woeseiaceae bacterium]|nr:amidohydrolase family protein [Woeseiaceae bacterium]
GKNEEVDLYTALDMYTRNAAYVMRLEDKTGTIEVGKRADLIVLDRNLFNIPTTEISEAKVLLTLMDGKEVFSLLWICDLIIKFLKNNANIRL